jgi:hypothetical protein
MSEAFGKVVGHDDVDDPEGQCEDDSHRRNDERRDQKQQKPGPTLRPADDAKEDDPAVNGNECRPGRFTVGTGLFVGAPIAEGEEDVEHGHEDQSDESTVMAVGADYVSRSQQMRSHRDSLRRSGGPPEIRWWLLSTPIPFEQR